ncbi:hypothetical protein LAZ67_5004186 [Cordylochernes scorpioides]|uniref:Retrovirus-related Pol polyprotein from transposon TNT 1-94 n=1 Tax=Cordylochernes scorpioides TaxID=51811 RepID=A0ABY6KHT4_9ARAC|nr:hypothetical protein LAZ67_5004186 [Cordylochernes scorpioides]
MFLAVNTRPDIAYITSKLSQYSRQPKQMHWTAIKRVMRYLRGTIDLGVKFERGKTGILKSYTDASWSTTHDGKSYGGYVLKLGEATIDWKSSKQPLVALSTMEAKMIAACESCCQIKWIINLLRELEEWNFMEKPTAIYTDSQSLINWISSPKQSSRCRHINRKYHFLRDCYESRDICLLYKPSQELEANIFTKDLSRDQMKKHLENLSIVGIKTKSAAGGQLANRKNFYRSSYYLKVYRIVTKHLPTISLHDGDILSRGDGLESQDFSMLALGEIWTPTVCLYTWNKGKWGRFCGYFLGRVTMMNLDNIMKYKDISLKIKKGIPKAFTFPMVIYGCEILRNEKRKRIEDFEISLESQICKQRLTYFRYIIRTSGLKKMLMLGKLKEERKT